MPEDTQKVDRTVTALTITNVLLAILAITIAVVFIYGEFFFAADADPEQLAPYAAEARERFNKHSDVIQEEVAALASETLPPIGTAVQQQVKEDFSRYLQALEQEGETYLSNVEQIFANQVKQQYRDYLQQHRQVLAEEFPEYATEEKLDAIMADFETTFDRIVERYYLDEFRAAADRTQQLWYSFEPVAEPVADEPSLNERLADYTADWLVMATTSKEPQNRTMPVSN